MSAGEPGPGVDARGRPVDDPTSNVLQLVAAANLRQDDLRVAAERRAEMLAKHAREMADLRAEYDQLLRNAETARIDAQRGEDQGQIQRAAEVAGTIANTLAAQVQTSAEALRGQVAAAATVQAAALAAADAKFTASLASAVAPLQEALADLRRVQYETAGGKTQVVEARAGAGESRSNVGMIVGIVGGLLALVGVTCSGLAIATTIVIALTR